jgi:cyanophycinase-like exopeptidase
MILARELPDLRRAGLGASPAFARIPARLVLPHFDRWKMWQNLMLSSLRRRLEPGEFALGVDEETALVGRVDEDWTVQGRQGVSVITRDDVRVYRPGEIIHFPSAIRKAI